MMNLGGGVDASRSQPQQQSQWFQGGAQSQQPPVQG